MEASLRINPNFSNPFPISVSNPKPCKTNASFRPNNVSCRATKLSISSDIKTTNFYDVLSLESENVGFDEIKKAYRNMARRYHPDVSPPWAKEESTARFVELREAYETLSDPVSRRMYDYQLSLDGSFGCGIEGFMIEDRESRFSKAVWERQLYELRQRSRNRMERKTSIFM